MTTWKAKFEKKTNKHQKCFDKVEKMILDKCMKIISIHSLQCIQCIQNIKETYVYFKQVNSLCLKVLP